MTLRIGILGGGAWGTALGNLLAKKGFSVLLWAREEEVVQSILKDHENKLFLPAIPLHQGLKASVSLEAACVDKDFVLSVIPAQFLRSVLAGVQHYLDPAVPLVCASKGIEIASLKLLSDVFSEILPTSSKLCFLSGPTFAKEIAQGLPAGATLAGKNPTATGQVQEWISTPHFKLYLSDDVIGVEVGGAVKNVIAIGAGIVDGLHLGLSLRASFMTRGLSEMTRLGVALGAEPLTFLGLSGMGDLILTCTGDLSRNRTLGLELTSGKTLQEIMGGRSSVTEGVATAKAVYQIAQKLSLDLPICEEIYRILYEEKPCLEAIRSLGARSLTSELAGII